MHGKEHRQPQPQQGFFGTGGTIFACPPMAKSLLAVDNTIICNSGAKVVIEDCGSNGQGHTA